MQVVPIRDRFEAAADENGFRHHLGEVKREDWDDKEWKAIIKALEHIATIDDIDIVNMSVGCAKKPPGIEEVMPKLANKILIASAGELYHQSIFYIGATHPANHCVKTIHLETPSYENACALSKASQYHSFVASLTAVEICSFAY